MTKILALDGSESIHGRGFLVVSSLYWCVEALEGIDVRILDVTSRDVQLALDVFQWDTGVRLTVQPDAEGLEDAALYGGIAFRSAAHLRLSEAARHDVPTLVAIQFPAPEWMSAPILALGNAAFDPKLFGERLRDAVRSWG